MGSNPSGPDTKKSLTAKAVRDFLKTNPNYNTNAPPFEVRGCKVISGGAFVIRGGNIAIFNDCRLLPIIKEI